MGHVISKVGSGIKSIVHVVTHPAEDVKDVGKEISKVANDVKDAVGSATHAVVHVIMHPKQDISDVVSGVKDVLNTAKHIGKATLHIVEHPGEAEKYVGELANGVGKGLLQVIMHPIGDVEHIAQTGINVAKSYVHTMMNPFSNVTQTIRDIKNIHDNVQRAKNLLESPETMGEVAGEDGVLDLAAGAGSMLNDISHNIFKIVQQKENNLDRVAETAQQFLKQYENYKKTFDAVGGMAAGNFANEWKKQVDPLRQTITQETRNKRARLL